MNPRRLASKPSPVNGASSPTAWDSSGSRIGAPVPQALECPADAPPRPPARARPSPCAALARGALSRRRPIGPCSSIGAHAGDAEITTGALLARHKRLGDRVVMLHLTLGEGGNPKMSPAAYGEQKKREALAAAQALGAEALFGPWKDGELRDTEEAARSWPTSSGR